MPAMTLEYYDLGEVFSKDWALSLPPHWPYVCAIDLLPGANPASGQLYNLSHPDSEAMEESFIDTLATGLICPSSSLVDASFFFGAKKDKSHSCIDYQCLNSITI